MHSTRQCLKLAALAKQNVAIAYKFSWEKWRLKSSGILNFLADFYHVWQASYMRSCYMWIAGNCMWKRKKQKISGAPVSQGPSSASPSRTLMILAFSPHPEQQGVGDVEPRQAETECQPLLSEYLRVRKNCVQSVQICSESKAPVIFIVFKAP